MPKFSKKAKHHAAVSKANARRQMKRSQQSSPVTVSWLPGFGPPPEPEPELPSSSTKLPFNATINGEEVIVYREAGKYVIEYLPIEEPDDPPAWSQ